VEQDAAHRACGTVPTAKRAPDILMFRDSVGESV
jgi:hypothetical protein